jgi:hypothetical protein
MTECGSPELQDLLPDFAAELLDDVSTARVQAHLGVCGACVEDLALLRVARRLRPPAPAIDVARIVAALPAPPSATVAASSRGPVLVRNATDRERAVPPTMRERPSRRPVVMGLPVWRLAATLGVVIAGGASLMVARRGIVAVDPAVGEGQVTQVAESVTQVATAPTRVLPESLGAGVSASSVTARTVSVSYGDLGDYTEDELQRMLDRLEQWDGATNEEPLPSTPIVSHRGGSL